MKKTTISFLILFLFIIIIVGCGMIGCGKREVEVGRLTSITPKPTPKIPEIKLEITPYDYIASSRRDVFVPLIKPKPKEEFKEEPKELPKKIEAVEIYELSIDTLKLTGMAWNGGDTVALLHDGGGFGYILKKGVLLGANFKPIKGIYGFVKGNKVTLFQGKRKVTFEFKEEKLEIARTLTEELRE